MGYNEIDYEALHMSKDRSSSYCLQISAIGLNLGCGWCCQCHLRITSHEDSSKATVEHTKKLDDEWPESIFHHVGSQSASYLLSVL